MEKKEAYMVNKIVRMGALNCFESNTINEHLDCYNRFLCLSMGDAKKIKLWAIKIVHLHVVCKFVM
jgi:hypothetical protein